jgi:preprotein translocase subunit YajC
MGGEVMSIKVGDKVIVKGKKIGTVVEIGEYAKGSIYTICVDINGKKDWWSKLVIEKYEK